MMMERKLYSLNDMDRINELAEQLKEIQWRAGEVI